jgi:hypothetical protein
MEGGKISPNPRYLLLLIIFISIAESQPQWEERDKYNYQWGDNFSKDLHGSTYVSRPLANSGIAELQIEIITDGDFAFKWMKEGGDNTFLRFYINSERKGECNDAVLTQSRRSYPVKNGDILKWLFSANDLGQLTATVFIPTELTSTPTIIKPSIIEIYTGFPLSNDLFIASGVRCSQGGTPIVDFSAVDAQKPGNYTYLVRCNEISAVQETGIIIVSSLKFDAPSSACAGQPGLDARVSEIMGADYYWFLDRGKIDSGQGTSRIKWTSERSSCNLSVRINLAGVKKNLSRNVSVDPNCVYLDYCDNLNKKIKNNSELRLVCASCGNNSSFKGKVAIEGIHNLTISPSSPGQKAALEGYIELGNSTDINIEGLDLRSDSIMINTDNLTNSRITKNKIVTSRGCAIHMVDSKNNIILDNDIQTPNNSITISGGENNTIEDCLDKDRIREIINNYNNTTQSIDVTCWVHDINNSCYTCNYTGTDMSIDLTNYTRNKWGDLYNWRPYCTP